MDRDTQSITFDQVRQSAQAAGIAVARPLDCNILTIPSATVAGESYTVLFFPNGQTRCTCKDGGRRCWHVRRAVELGGRARVLQPAAPPVSAAVARRARGLAAVADLFGVAA